MQLAQSDLDRAALDQTRLARIRDTVVEFVEDLSGQDDGRPVGNDRTVDAEAVDAVETVAPASDQPYIPVLDAAALSEQFRGENAVLCIGGRTKLDEAAAVMFSQLCRAHGVGSRVEGPEALSTTNIFRLDTSGVALVCLSYIGITSPAHLRYAVRRLRRKLPHASIMVGCWAEGVVNIDELRETAKADLFATSLREAAQIVVSMAQGQIGSRSPIEEPVLLAQA
jgi:hypothetical protein